MNTDVIQRTLVGLCLMVLAFVVGTLVAGDAKEAFLFVSAVAGLFVVIALGRRCWWLIFLAPPLLSLVPLGIVSKLPMGFAAATGIMLYWVLMTMTGAARLCWRSLGWVDFMVLLLACLFAYSYYSHPVVMGFLGGKDGVAGGSAYIWCIFGILYYVILSSIPCSRKDLDPVLHWAVWISAISAVLSSLWEVLGVGGSGEGLGSEMAGSRFGLFVGLGQVIILLIVCRYKLWRILVSPLLLGAVLLGLAMVFLSGFREKLVCTAVLVIYVAIIRREFITVTLLAAGTYALLIFMSSTGLMLSLPFGIQRTLSIVPGVEVSDDVKRGAQHSADWRVEMWGWAMDPRTGYIKDYTWGDGFAVDMRVQSRQFRMVYRDRIEGAQGDLRFYAKAGLWHNGSISTIHRVGYVGLVLVSIWFLVCLILVARMCAAYQGTPQQFYYLYYTVPLAELVTKFYISAGGVSFAFQMMTYAALAKQLYVFALEEGRIQPLFGRSSYVPRMLRWNEEKKEFSSGAEPQPLPRP